MATKVTELDVLRATRKQLAKRGGLVIDTFHMTPTGSVDSPGPNVHACCAIGGVEQAIWKLTGSDVSESRGDLARNSRTLLGELDEQHRLYAKTMMRVNKIARRMCRGTKEEQNWGRIHTIEDVTFAFERPRKKVLDIIDAAIAEVAA